ncbi:MAG: hypothetical protein ACRDP5_00460 [Streptosporangiaceae bacterium]
MGLSIVRSIVAAHEGTVRARPRPDGGLIVEIEFPDLYGSGVVQVARRRTSQMVAAMSSADSASSQPPSIHWKGQNRLPG